MRFMVGLAAALPACVCLAQFGGEYTDAKGASHRWSVSSSNVLIWDGAPWIPLGPRVSDTDADKLAGVAAAGLRSVLISFSMDTPLQPLTDAAESAGLTYLLSPGSRPPDCAGYYIMPQSYRVADLHGEMDLRLRVPGATSAFFVLADADTYGVVNIGEVRVDAGFANVAVRPKRSGNYVLLLYPHAQAGNVPDFWEGYDAWRDTLLGKLKTLMPGPGLRGFVDPMGAVSEWYNLQRRFVPTSPLFRLEFERHLRRTYPDLARLSSSWELLGDRFESYHDAARRIPLFDQGRGMFHLWDPETHDMMNVGRGCRYWEDFEAFLKGVAARRAANLATAIRRLVDVPVLYAWRGWTPISQESTAAGQGIGMTGYGAGFGAAEHWGAHALGASLTWQSAPWLVAVDVAADAYGKPIGAEAEETVSVLASLGAKGFFLRTALDADGLAKLAAARSRLPVPDEAPKVLEFPETAQTPADVMSMPGGVWWVPSPRVGSRLDLGEDYDAYRLETDGRTMVVIWSRRGERNVFLRVADPEAIRVATYAGELIEPKKRRDGIEVRLSELPTVFLTTDDLPIPNELFQGTDDVIRAYFAAETDLHADFSDLKYDYNRALEGLPRNPGNAYSLLRGIYNSIMARAARYLWLEGEQPEKTTFGSVASSAAASAGRYLAVDTPFHPLAGSYTAAYAFKTSAVGELKLLIAGSLPEQGTLRFEYSLDGAEPVAFPTEAVSYYGGRFAWYDAGKIRVPEGRHTLTVHVRGQEGAYYDAAIDVVLLTSADFRPSGARRPPAPLPK